MVRSSSRFVSQITRDTVAVILAGGKGKRLHELTTSRAAPALQFGGKFRIIDFPLSNCINSGIRRVGVITQYRAHSLLRHLVNGWGSFNRDLGEFIELLPASQQRSDNWYLGTADALFQNQMFVRSTGAKYTLVLAGDQVYQMDYGALLAEHVNKGADVTMSCIQVDKREAAANFGVLQVDKNNKVIDFHEKPLQPATLTDAPEKSLISTGIYVFNTDFLFEQLSLNATRQDCGSELGADVLPLCVEKAQVYAHPFTKEGQSQTDYWRDVGTLDRYWEANMELARPLPGINLYNDTWPIWTYQRQSAPAKFVFNDNHRRGCAVDSLVSGGCIVSGSVVDSSVLFTDVRVHSYSTISHSVILPRADIGRGAKLNKTIIDAGCRVPGNIEIGLDHSDDRRRGFRVTANGVVVVTQRMLDNLSVA